MAKLTLHELENLSRLLLSEEDYNTELGFEILKNNKPAIPMLCRELVLIWQMHDNKIIRTQVELMLQSKYSAQQLEQWNKGFDLFRLIPNFYTYKLEIKQILMAHENIRPDYQALINQNSKYCLKYHFVAKKLHQTFDKHLDLAEAYYRISLKTNPSNEDNLFYLAYLLDKSPANYPEALQLYLTRASLVPNSSATYNNIGLIYDNLEQPNLAYEYYTKALAISPSESIYLRNMASLCINSMDGDAYKKQAKELLEKLLKVDPKNGSNWNTLADYLWNIEGNIEEAKNAYLEGLKVAPKNSFLVGNLGELYIDAYGLHDEGLELYKKSIKLKETPYRLVIIITLLVQHYQDFVTAKKYYKKLIALSPPNEIIKNRYLRADQWEAFLEARKKMM